MATSYNLLFWLTLMVFVGIDASPKYRIRLERAVVVEQNPEYVEAKIWTAKINRTDFGLNVNLNILKTFPSNAMYSIKCYEFLSNEYRPFAITVTRTLCDFLKNQYAYFVYRDTPNFLPPKCPLRPGNFTIANYTIPTNLYPANLPFKQAMSEFKFTVGKIIIIHFQVYLKYDRDIIIREEYS